MTPQATRHADAPTWLVWTSLWIVYIVWGSTYLAIRIVVETMPPMLAGAARFVVAGAILYLFLMLKRGARAMKVSGREIAASAFVGGALLMGGNGLVMIAEQGVPSGLAALLIATVPLWVVLMRRVTGDKVSRGTLGGVGVGFVGVALLVLPGEASTGADTGGVILLLIASLSWAIGSFLSPKLPLPKDPFTSTAVQMLCGGLILLLVGLILGEASQVRFEEFSAASAVALLYLIVIGSWLAFTAYVWALQNAPISKVATYAYVNPVIALFLGWLILSEKISLPMLAGAAVIVASVAGIVRRESGAKKQEKLEAAPAALAGADAS
ncbi:MAG: EamA family transporter [Actinomycetota bacterium]